jgi:hypothetical protein
MAKEVKKTSSKKSTKKGTKKTTNKRTSSKADKNLEKILIENFISMQKVMTHLAEKFDKLDKQVSSLLDLFEKSAKTISEKEINLEIQGNEENQKEVMEKLQSLLDQNKLIAKGITLMHEAATNPSVQYSIGKNEREPQTMQRQMMPQTNIPSSSRPKTKEEPEDNGPQLPQSTSPMKKPTVMEEEDNNSPTFSI